MHPKYRHGNGRCKHTHTRHYKQGAPLGLLWDEWWGSRAGDSIQTRVWASGAAARANGHGITAPQALLQAGANTSSTYLFFSSFLHVCNE